MSQNQTLKNDTENSSKAVFEDEVKQPESSGKFFVEPLLERDAQSYCKIFSNNEKVVYNKEHGRLTAKVDVSYAEVQLRIVNSIKRLKRFELNNLLVFAANTRAAAILNDAFYGMIRTQDSVLYDLHITPHIVRNKYEELVPGFLLEKRSA